MNIGLISKRYAKALLEYAQEQKAEEQVYQEMMLLERTLRNGSCCARLLTIRY